MPINDKKYVQIYEMYIQMLLTGEVYDMYIPLCFKLRIETTVPFVRCVIVP